MLLSLPLILRGLTAEVCAQHQRTKQGRLHRSQRGILGEYTATSERGAKMCCEELQQMQKSSQQSIQRDTRKLSLPKNQERREGTD